MCLAPICMVALDLRCATTPFRCTHTHTNRYTQGQDTRDGVHVYPEQLTCVGALYDMPWMTSVASHAKRRHSAGLLRKFPTGSLLARHFCRLRRAGQWSSGKERSILIVCYQQLPEALLRWPALARLRNRFSARHDFTSFSQLTNDTYIRRMAVQIVQAVLGRHKRSAKDTTMYIASPATLVSVLKARIEVPGNNWDSVFQFSHTMCTRRHLVSVFEKRATDNSVQTPKSSEGEGIFVDSQFFGYVRARSPHHVHRRWTSLQ